MSIKLTPGHHIHCRCLNLPTSAWPSSRCYPHGRHGRACVTIRDVKKYSQRSGKKKCTQREVQPYDAGSTIHQLFMPQVWILYRYFYAPMQLVVTSLEVMLLWTSIGARGVSSKELNGLFVRLFYLNFFLDYHWWKPQILISFYLFKRSTTIRHEQDTHLT
jgi:hypothetical protein